MRRRSALRAITGQDFGLDASAWGRWWESNRARYPKLEDGPLPTPEPVRVGGRIEPPRKTKNVDPIYPPAAQADDIGIGVVVLEVVIGPDGRVTDVKVLRSVPLLDVAAIETVRQWEYTPTLLNGVAVLVIMAVTVNFRPR